MDDNVWRGPHKESQIPATMKPLVIPSVEQMRLIARILNGLCAEFTEPFMTPLGMVAMRCRFCKVLGVPFGIDQMRYEHTDECVLALNDQLQQSMEHSVLSSQHTKEQG